jgi:hypothetical protein
MSMGTPVAWIVGQRRRAKAGVYFLTSKVFGFN